MRAGATKVLSSEKDKIMSSPRILLGLIAAFCTATVGLTPSPGIARETQPAAQPCRTGDCRGIDGQERQYGQLEKDVPGELEAVIIEIRNGRTGDAVTLVDKVHDPDCAASIPAATAGVSCTGRFKIEAAASIESSGSPADGDGAARAALCTFDELDDVNRFARTPASQNLILTDVEGRQCKAAAKESDQWGMLFRSCCSPTPELGEAGDPIFTTTMLVVDHGGQCIVNEVRPDRRDPRRVAKRAPDEPGSCL